MKNDSPLAHISDKNVDYYHLTYSPSVTIMKNYGFIKLFDRMIDYPEFTLMDRIVYGALYAYTQMSTYQGTTIVTNDTLAIRLGISRSTVKRSLSHLQELGVIQMKKHREKEMRIIKVMRDFKVQQSEEAEYWRNNPNSFAPH